MLKNLRKLIKDIIPHSSLLKKPHSAAILTPHSAAISRMEAYPHFDFESPQDLSVYTNISLVHPKDIDTFLTGIDTFIFDCDGVIVNFFLLMMLKILLVLWKSMKAIDYWKIR